MAADRGTCSDEHVRAVGRAVAILEQFSLERPELSFTQICAAVGLSKSTTHRLLTTLEREDLLEYDPRSSRYRLSLKMFRLGSVVGKSMQLATQADALLERLAAQTSETAFLVVPDGDEALCMRRVDGSHHVRVLFLETGMRQPYNTGAAPRVLLAYTRPERWEDLVAHHVRRMTEHSLVTREALLRDRYEIRRRGFAVSVEDVTLHAAAVGVPVRDASGVVVAALSLSGIVQRFGPDRQPDLVRLTVRAAAELSRRIGYVPPQRAPAEPQAVSQARPQVRR
jgi:DNA-binding IclR family transcriptional regulator